MTSAHSQLANDSHPEQVPGLANAQTQDLSDLQQLNQLLEGMTAPERVAWALENLPQQAVVSSSFGAQAAVMLHLLTQQQPDIPVILTDTGYLFPETYRFVDELTERLGLNLHIYRAKLTPAWQEAKFGQLWEQGAEGLKRYNDLNKVEPMGRALQELGAGTWFAGLRRNQSQSPAQTPLITIQRGVFKVHPIADWNDRDIYNYLKENDLPYHPLWDQGYVSIGDTHTTVPLTGDMTPEQTRFYGLQRECGLHTSEQDGSGI